MIKAHSLTMARYHGWAFDRLFASLEAVSDADWRADHGLFFKSLHGTLNHLLLADLIWYGRFTGQPHAAASLADEVESDRATLRQRVRAQAERWIELVERADEATFASRLRYASMAAQPCDAPWAGTLLHVFNHATHHRGQMSAVATRLGQPAPEMDLVYFLRLSGL
ncbi:DinB family protein [Methyloversatilis sp. MC4-4]|uniref:DinB family protein n=1 Tax=Methyloversatilis sp. MC4-4 TaxID=3132824 RepID=UPI003CE99C3D